MFIAGDSNLYSSYISVFQIFFFMWKEVYLKVNYNGDKFSKPKYLLKSS